MTRRREDGKRVFSFNAVLTTKPQIEVPYGVVSRCKWEWSVYEDAWVTPYMSLLSPSLLYFRNVSF